MALTLTLNGNSRSFEELEQRATLAKVIAELGLKADRVAVERNGEIVSRAAWAMVEMQTGDRLEVVHFVGGGCGMEQRH